MSNERRNRLYELPLAVIRTHVRTTLDKLPTNIAKGDFAHRLGILVEEYIRHKPEAKGLRQWAEEDRPEPGRGPSVYIKLRLAYTPRCHAFHSSAIARYEDMIAG